MAYYDPTQSYLNAIRQAMIGGTLAGYAPPQLTQPTPIVGPQEQPYVDQTTSFANRINEIRQQQQMMGVEALPEYNHASPQEYIELLNGTQFGSEYGPTLAQEFLGKDYSQVTQDAAARGIYEGDPMGGLLGHTIGAQGLGQYIPEMTQLAMLVGGGLATAAATGLGGYGAGAASGGGGGAAPAAVGDGLSPITVSTPMLPGGTGAGVSAVQGAFAGAPMAALPAAVATPSAIGGFTGVDPISGGIADAAGNVIPGTENPTSATSGGIADDAGMRIEDNFPNNRPGGSVLGTLGDYLPEILSGIGAIYNNNQTQANIDKATEAYTKANEQGLAFARESRDMIMAQQEPFRQAAVQATGALTDMTGLTNNGYQWQTDPGYQFRIREGMKALENSAAAKGGLLSGNFGQEALRYATDYSSQEYTNVYNRIASIAGMNQVSGPLQATATNLYGNNALNAAQASGAVNASGYMAGSNSTAQMLNQITEALGGIDWTSIFSGRKKP